MKLLIIVIMLVYNVMLYRIEDFHVDICEHPVSTHCTATILHVFSCIWFRTVISRYVTSKCIDVSQVRFQRIHLQAFRCTPFHIFGSGHSHWIFHLQVNRTEGRTAADLSQNYKFCKNWINNFKKLHEWEVMINLVFKTYWLAISLLISPIDTFIERSIKKIDGYP